MRVSLIGVTMMVAVEDPAQVTRPRMPNGFWKGITSGSDVPPGPLQEAVEALWGAIEEKKIARPSDTVLAINSIRGRHGFRCRPSWTPSRRITAERFGASASERCGSWPGAKLSRSGFIRKPADLATREGDYPGRTAAEPSLALVWWSYHCKPSYRSMV